MPEYFEDIMARMLQQVPDTVDKREGSIIYDALAPAAMELSLCYQEIEGMYQEMFPDTASRAFLIKIAAERGIAPEEPTQAVIRVSFTPRDAPVMGCRFSCGDYNYIVYDEIDDGEYRMRCETFGSAGNISSGVLIPIDYVEGLETAVVSELLIPGQDEESTESLRNKYFYSVSNIPFGGNIADYKKIVEEYDGVGACKVVPVWNGGGTVKIIFLDATYQPPSASLIFDVQTYLDPTQNAGEGEGMAPIGHVVTVVGAGTTTVNIASEFTFQTGYDLPACMAQLEAAADAYFAAIAESWSATANCIVRISQLESRFLDCDGILDVQGTTLNGTAANLQLDADKIPVRGTIADAS